MGDVYISQAMNDGHDGREFAALGPDDWVMRGDEAREYVESAAMSVASLVRSTLGPAGMEKLIETVDHQGKPEIVHATDAGVILDAIERGDGFNHPVAALFVDAVDSMQRGLGDGATTATILGAELLRAGFDLVERGVRPGAVVVGYGMAASHAGEVLDAMARAVDADDRELLERIAATSMTADVAPERRRAYAAAVADAVEGLAAASDSGWLDADAVAVLAATGERRRLHRGVVLRRRPTKYEESERARSEFDWRPDVPVPIEDAAVAVIDGEVDVEKTATDISGNADAAVTVSTAAELESYATERTARIDRLAADVAALGVDVLVSQEELSDEVRVALERAGVALVDRVQYPLTDVYRLADATGATVVSHLDDLSADAVGVAGTVSERRVGDELWATFDDCAGSAFTIVVDSPTEAAAIEHERLVEDAVDVVATAVMDGQVLPGAGAPAVAVARSLRDHAASVPGREQLAVEAAADALEELVVALATNAGLDGTDALVALRRAHAGADGPVSYGLDLRTGEPTDAWTAGVVEPRRVFSQAVETAITAAEQLLTIDAVLHPGVDLSSTTPRTEHD